MWSGLEAAIREAADRKIRNFERHRKLVFDENQRRLRRSIAPPPAVAPFRPPLWDVEPAFDPYHVRARARVIAFTISQKLRSGSYVPISPGGFVVPKPTGEPRIITNFAIADEVISTRLYRSLLKKNRPRLSARSYAYRDDVNIYDAIAHMQSEWRDEHRVFVAEYDFTDFFDSISHDHIWHTIKSLRVTMTSLEEKLLQVFLSAPIPNIDPIHRTAGTGPRVQGVPLGTSISLLLANVAASPLDRSLERLGVGFARYADDTVIWSRDYSSICRAVDELHQASKQIGSPVNQRKSMGIRLLVSEQTTRAELPWTHAVSYLSHSIGLTDVRMNNESVAVIKRHIASLIYNNLLREPLRGTQRPSRLVTNDNDYIVLVWQMRRYLYGALSEEEVRRLSRGPVPLMPLSGAMSRFPLVDDDEQLRELDRWITAQTWLALRKRAAVLTKARVVGTSPNPWGLPRSSLPRLRLVSSSGSRVDVRLPSVLRMSLVVREAVRTHGSEVVGHGLGLYGPRH